MPKFSWLFAAVVLVAGCAAAPAPEAPVGPAPPREIRLGAQSAVQQVETSVTQAEVEAAIRDLVSSAPVCTSWPTLWLQETGNRFQFQARYDLMARDWGADVAAASRERMEEFVSMGFLSRDEGAPEDAGAVIYQITPAGRETLRGSPYGTVRPSFCGPSERTLVSVTAMDWVQSDCGNLRVRFSHVANDWPSWARTDTTRRRLAEIWPANGEPAEGAVTLSRQWYSTAALPRGQRNGALHSVCFDPQRQRVIGDDLTLFAAD